MNGPCLRTKPKFIRFHNLINVSPQTARGLLEFLWDSVQDTGDPVIGDAAAIEAAAGWTGEPGKLCQALLACGGQGKFGFIEEIPNRPGIYQLHDLLQHTPADRQRDWIRQQERMERGTTISEIRRAAADARWAKQHAKNDFAMANDASAKPHAADANSDAKSCTPMQTDAVCMPLHTHSNTTGPCKQIPPVENSRPRSYPDVPTGLEVKDYFKSLGFFGDVKEFLRRFGTAVNDLNSRAARNGWQKEAYLYVGEMQEQSARGNPNARDTGRQGDNQLKSGDMADHAAVAR